MVQINLNAFSEDYLLNYLNFLINRVYKCLPMREQNEPSLKVYIDSLLRELIGNRDLINELKNNGNFICLIGKLNYLSQNEVDKKSYRKDILDSISIIEKIKKEVCK